MSNGLIQTRLFFTECQMSFNPHPSLRRTFQRVFLASSAFTVPPQFAHFHHCHEAVMLGLGACRGREERAGMREAFQIWLRVRWRKKEKNEVKEMKKEKKRTRIAFLFLIPAIFRNYTPTGYMLRFFFHLETVVIL